MLLGMETATHSYETQRLDHLGIVAGICKQINLVKIIDESLPSPTARKVSCGQATLAMVLNAMGLTGRALYLMPEYLANKPVDLLIGSGLAAEDFNDDTLGRALDELHQVGVTELFARVAAAAVGEFGISYRYAHLDTTSFSLQGQYESAVAEEAFERYGAVKVTHGYSKEQRPDLKQVVVTLITSQAAALPLWLEVLDGNSSDKQSFNSTVQAYCRQLADATPPWFIMDSAAYSQENLVAWQGIGWVTRVPETIAAARQVIKAVASGDMADVGNGYRVLPLGSVYASIKQRWLLVYSESAYRRESQQLDKRVAQAQKAADKAWRSLLATTFQCQADAQAALAKLGKKHSWHSAMAQVKPIHKHLQPGRPAKNALPQTIGWGIEGQLVENQATIEEARQWLGRFILATNILDTDQLPENSLLSCYKEQGSAVERGFRFLKDPLFFAHSLFLKSPARIMAMIMVMGLALLVYALAERELRRQLALQNETLPDQTGKPSQSLTMRRVAQMFEGVDLLIIKSGSQVTVRQILNLSPVRLKVLQLFGPAVQNCYLLDF
jgi:transposase